MKVLLEVRGVTKRFPGVTALQNVDFQLYEGEIHALLGENGSGKTTLACVIYGIYIPDSGEIRLEGRRVIVDSPKKALQLGIAYVPQHPVLIESFTGLENIALHLGVRPSAELEEKVREVIEEVGLKVDVRRRVWQMSVIERMRLELIKALIRKPKVLILDEASTAFTEVELKALHAFLKKYAKKGVGVIYITHKVSEVFEIADRVSVLRRGVKVGTFRVSEVTEADLIRHMFGVEKVEEAPKRPVETKIKAEKPVLEVGDLVVEDDFGVEAVKGVSFRIYKGEIVGIAGLAGSGQRELLEAIAGVRRAKKGVIKVMGIDVTKEDARERRRLGVTFIPEERIGVGVLPYMTILENLIVRNEFEIGGRLLLDYAKARQMAFKAIQELGITPANPDLPAKCLSGGNMQKVIVARELLMPSDPKLVIALYPTRGLDVETANTVRRLFLRCRERGVSVLFTSEDLDELLAISDRIFVMSKGRIVREFITAVGVEKGEIAKWLVK